MSGFAVHWQGLGAEELASVVRTVGGIPSPGDVMPWSRGWLLIFRH